MLQGSTIAQSDVLGGYEAKPHYAHNICWKIPYSMLSNLMRHVTTVADGKNRPQILRMSKHMCQEFKRLSCL
jgi:hypothetical protein